MFSIKSETYLCLLSLKGDSAVNEYLNLKNALDEIAGIICKQALPTVQKVNTMSKDILKGNIRKLLKFTVFKSH